MVSFLRTFHNSTAMASTTLIIKDVDILTIAASSKVVHFVCRTRGSLSNEYRVTAFDSKQKNRVFTIVFAVLAKLQRKVTTHEYSHCSFHGTLLATFSLPLRLWFA